MLSRCYDPEMIYVSLDCEASGPIPPLYNLLSIGATIVFFVIFSQLST